MRLNCTPQRIFQILRRPDIFKELFGLDSEAHEPVDPSNLSNDFVAKIQKRLPILIPNQDYKMHYTSKESGDYIFQHIEQVEDQQDFAIRETLIVIQKSGNEVIFREIGKIMPMSWMIRALGPQLRQITKSELTKMNEVLKCVAESNETITDQLAAKCYR